MATTWTCTYADCGFEWTDTNTFTNIGGVAGKGSMLIASTCPRCHRRFDATPGGAKSGMFSTGADGRLYRVVDFVRENDVATLRDVATKLAQAVRERDEALARETLEQAGMSLTEQRLWYVVGLLVAVLAIVIPLKSQPQGVTPEQIVEIVQEVEQDHPQKDPGRNEPCWCGSGTKFKRCHGSPQLPMGSPPD